MPVRGRRTRGRSTRSFRGRGGGVGLTIVAVLAGLAVFSLTEDGTWRSGGFNAQQITGYARVLDGDTVEIEGTRIRLHGTIISCMREFFGFGA